MSADRPVRVAFRVNGKPVEVTADPTTPLLWVLRDLLQLTGTKYGCGIGVCGACAVLEAGKALRSCQLQLAAAAGRSFTTLEGLSPAGEHPVQRAWLEEDVSQCGWCQTGMILETVALLAEHPDPTDEQIDVALYDVLCRCGSYPRVRRAVHRAAELARAGPAAPPRDPKPPGRR